ncbi:Rieske 2Fe-2S domain-containing protein [bacterium]|nr:Rieske 2Fe-2S domain-containing protein [bacterium]
MAGPAQTRRRFLQTLIPAVAGLVGCWRYLTPVRASLPREVTLPAAEVPQGGALVLPEHGLAVTRGRDGGLRALDLTCTHLGCRVNATENGFTCPCHGSRFAPDGAALTGPATRALRELDCRQDGDRVTVRLPEAT